MATLRSFAIALAFSGLLLFPSTATAAPACIAQPDWSDYFFAFPGGCTIGNYLISDFRFSPSGATDVRFPTPLLADGTVGLDFSLLDTNPFSTGTLFSAGAGQTKTFALSFTTTAQAGADLLGGSVFSLAGAEVTGTGALAATELICLNGAFTLAQPASCSSGVTATSVAVNAPQTSGTATFPVQTSVGMLLTVTMSGGTSGTARVTGFRMLATEVPEPAALLLLAAGAWILAPALRGRRSKEA